MRCGSCGSAVPDGAKFCPTCGASQATSVGERRLVTVLHADVVGYTALAERRDPEQVKRLIDGWFERLTADITTFGGVIDKLLGDGIVALFGAPVAHGDDAERAVRAGLRMQQTLASGDGSLDPIQMRIGINTGEVLVGSSSTGGDYTAMGDVMNLGARLEQLAEPGQVLVGSTTRAATVDAIAYRPVGVLTAAGREQTVEGWVAEAPLRRPGERRQRTTRFVGRELELDALLAQGALAIGRERSHLAAIIGDAGVGKTRLVHEAADRLRAAHTGTVLIGRCVPYGEANVWWPAAELLRDLFGVGADASPEEARAALAVFADPGAAAEECERSETALLHALGYATVLRGGDRQRNRAEVTWALTSLVSRLLDEGPVVIVLSDIHWAAEAIWALLDHLLTQLSREQLVVLVTARHIEDELPFARWHGSSVTQLGPLTEDGARAMLSELELGAGGELTDELVRRSGGNPFFLEELSALAADRGLAAVGLGPDLPDNLRGLIAARLDGLDAPVRAVLDDAAVLGRAGVIGGLRVMADKTRDVLDIDLELAALESADLLWFDGGRYSFRSDLVREVAYGMLTKSDRVERHLGIAGYLESLTPRSEVRNSTAAGIAEHYRSAHVLLDELGGLPHIDGAQISARAEEWVHEAGRRALDAGEPRQGEAWMSSGLELFSTGTRVARFLLGRAQARCEMRLLPAARADLDQLASLDAVDDLTRARAMVVLGDVERKTPSHEAASRLLADAAEWLEALDALTDAALAWRLLGLAQMEHADPSARRSMERSRELGESAGDDRSVAWATQNLAWLAFREGRVGSAERQLDEARRLFTALGDRGGLVWVEGMEAWVAFHTGDWERSARLVETVSLDAERRGDPWAQAVMGSLRANLELWTGRAERAQETAREAVELAIAASDVSIETQGRGLEGRATISRGRVDDGLRLLTDNHARAEASGDASAVHIAAVLMTAALARIGDAEQAIRWAALARDGADDPGLLSGVDLLGSVGVALLQLGSVDAAARQLDSMLDEHARHSDVRTPPGFLLAVGAMTAVAAGDLDLAERRVDLALDGVATYLDEVLALGARAAVRFRRGDDAGVMVALQAAHERVLRTDDRITPAVLALLAALLTGVSLVDAEARLASLGARPIGWTTLWSLAAGLPLVDSTEQSPG